jgi:hypothetical protein
MRQWPFYRADEVSNPTLGSATLTLLFMFVALGLSAFGKLSWPITIPILLPGMAVSMWITHVLSSSTQMPGLRVVGYMGLLVGFLLNWGFLIVFHKIRTWSIHRKRDIA